MCSISAPFNPPAVAMPRIIRGQTINNSSEEKTNVQERVAPSQLHGYAEKNNPLCIDYL